MARRFHDYFKPKSLEAALSALADAQGNGCIIAGGTDLLLEKSAPGAEDQLILIDIGDIEGLSGIQIEGSELIIGAGAKLSTIEHAQEVFKNFPILNNSIKEIGSPQIRNLATLGGNLCNGSPAADSVPGLLVLDAKLEITSLRGRREVPLAEFFLAPGKTILKKDEILTCVKIPLEDQKSFGSYIKLKAREALDLAFVGVAVMILDSGGKREVKIALGAVSPIPFRVSEAEGYLNDAQDFSSDALWHAAEIASRLASPISDVRASENYRKGMVRNLTYRALHQNLIRFGGSEE
jgi:xanthine dehydrogenase FAD-binding subunit